MSIIGRQAGRLSEAVLLFVLFFGPVFLALVAYLGPWDIVPNRSTAHGELIEPAQQLPSVALADGAGGQTDQDWLRGRWSLIYVSPSTCDDGCRARLAALAQIHIALAEDYTRLQRVLLYPGTAVPPTDDGVIAIPLAGDAAVALGALLAAAHPGPIYVSDPMGTLALAYGSDADSQGVLKDLKRLLRLSRIG